MIRFWREQSDWDDKLKVTDAGSGAEAVVPTANAPETAADPSQAASIIEGNHAELQRAGGRATDLVRRAAELLDFAEGGVVSLEAAYHAAEVNLIEANARTDEAYAHIDRLEQALWAADQRAKDAELRATEAENAIMTVQDAIRKQLLEATRWSEGHSRAAA